jgi:hypothetical protein
MMHAHRLLIALVLLISACRFEGSGMTVAPHGGRDWLWIVFDNLLSIGRVDEQFEFRWEVLIFGF